MKLIGTWENDYYYPQKGVAHLMTGDTFSREMTLQDINERNGYEPHDMEEVRFLMVGMTYLAEIGHTITRIV